MIRPDLPVLGEYSVRALIAPTAAPRTLVTPDIQWPESGPLNAQLDIGYGLP
jgi:hypothetical protein